MPRENLALSLLRLLAEHGAEIGWAEAPTGPVRYAVRGPPGAPPLLLLHGLGDSIVGWAQPLLRLSRKFRVHALDLPGHGLSPDPPDFRLATFLSALRHYAESLRAPLLVGHSLGGWLAARLALDAAIHPSGLVLVNPAGALLPAEEWNSLRALLADGGSPSDYFARAFHRAPLALRLFPGEVARAISSPAARGLVAAVVAEDFLTAERLASLDVPVRLIWGSRDRLLPSSSLAFFRAALPRAEVVLLPEVGHCPHLEAPAELSRAILRPLPKLEAGAARRSQLESAARGGDPTATATATATPTTTPTTTPTPTTNDPI